MFTKRHKIPYMKKKKKKQTIRVYRHNRRQKTELETQHRGRRLLVGRHVISLQKVNGEELSPNIVRWIYLSIQIYKSVADRLTSVQRTALLGVSAAFETTTNQRIDKLPIDLYLEKWCDLRLRYFRTWSGKRHRGHRFSTEILHDGNRSN